MGGGGGPEAEFYGGPAPRGWRTVPEGRAGGGSAGVRGRGVARGLVAASGAVVAGRRKGRPRSPFLRGDTAGTFPRRRFLSRRGRACCCVRYRGRGAKERKAPEPILARGHGRNFPAAAVFEPAGQGLLLRPVPRSRGGGEESLGSILVRGHGRNFSAAAVFEPAGSTSDAGNGYLCIRLRRCVPAACGAALRLTATHDRFCRH